MLHLLNPQGFIEFVHPPAETRPERWLIGMAYAGREYATCRRIEDEVGIAVYLPFEIKQRRAGRNRLVDIVVPLLRTYFFVPAAIDDRSYHDVKHTNGVLDFLQINGKPGVIRDTELKWAREKELASEQLRRRRILQSGQGPRFMIGEAVKVSVGFAALDAVVHEIPSDKRVRVRLNEGAMFGRDVVEVDLSHLKSAA